MINGTKLAAAPWKVAAGTKWGREPEEEEASEPTPKIQKWQQLTNPCGKARRIFERAGDPDAP